MSPIVRVASIGHYQFALLDRDCFVVLIKCLTIKG